MASNGAEVSSCKKENSVVMHPVRYKSVEELPDEVWDAARDYQSNMEKYNPIIWEGGTSDNITRLRNIIGTHCIAEEAIFYRRASLADLGEDLSNCPLDELPGKSYQFQGIMSASNNANMAAGDVIFEIKAPAGMPALDLTDVDYFQEILFDSPQCAITEVATEGYNTNRISINVSAKHAAVSFADIQTRQRTVFEIATLKDSLELSNGDSSICQFGGVYREVKKNVDSTRYEVHHIPPQSIFIDNFEDLPAIAMLKEDHANTSSYRGKMNKTYQAHFSSEMAYTQHKQGVKELIEQGMLAEAIRNEIYEIRDAFGTKYDGAIREYLDSMLEYISSNGVLKVKN